MKWRSCFLLLIIEINETEKRSIRVHVGFGVLPDFSNVFIFGSHVVQTTPSPFIHPVFSSYRARVMLFVDRSVLKTTTFRDRLRLCIILILLCVFDAFLTLHLWNLRLWVKLLRLGLESGLSPGIVYCFSIFVHLDKHFGLFSILY